MRRPAIGVRGHVVLLVVAIAAPLAVVAAREAQQRRTDDEHRARADVQRLARDGAVRAEGLLDRTDVLVQSLTRQREVSDNDLGEACDEIKTLIEGERSKYTGLFIFDRNGVIRCSAEDMTEQLTLDDREWLAHVASGGDEPHLSAPRFDPVVRETTMLYGLRGPHGYVFAAGVRPSALADSLDVRNLPVGATSAVLDDTGTALVTRGGEPIPDAIGAAARGGRTTLVADDVDGAARVYGLAALEHHDDALVYAVGFPEATVVRDATAQLRRSLLYLAIGTVVALVLGLLLAEWLLVRRVRHLRDTARAFTDGDLSARVAARDDRTELGELGAALDAMAAALAERTALAEGTARDLQAALDALEVSAAQRQAVLASVVRAQELERQRVAYELHDDTVQVLTALGLRLRQLRAHVTGASSVELVDQLATAVTDATVRLRSLLVDLRPPALDTAGLAGALRELLDRSLPDRVERRFDWRLDEDELDETSRVVLYRVAAEALGNVRQHARASEVSVEAWCDAGTVTLKIADDGAGFDTRTAPPAGHLGLIAMRERLELIDGTLRVSSLPGAGTSVVATVRRAGAGA
jgi:signal transduction histidine kinase